MDLKQCDLRSELLGLCAPSFRSLPHGDRSANNEKFIIQYLGMILFRNKDT